MSLLQDLALTVASLSDANLPRFARFHERFGPHYQAIQTQLYGRLDREDRRRFVQWILKRWGGMDLVNPVERSLYNSTLRRAQTEHRDRESLNGRPYFVRDFGWQGADIRLLGYEWFLGVHDVLYNQYEHAGIALKPDDVVIDAGAFIGDTAVLFHHKLQGRCQIHSFELLDENLDLLLHNLERNGIDEGAITLNKLALADRSGDEITVGNSAIQGATSMFGRGGGAKVQTITLDDYVTKLELQRVDFIKMDIEGAEEAALKGAAHTIRLFRPRLAICLYHRWDDAWRLPAAILATGVDYRFAFKWVQLKDGWEAVLLAEPAASQPAATSLEHTGAAWPDPAEAALKALLDKLARRESERAALAPSAVAAKVQPQEVVVAEASA
jgi:FkbM family methyltransferase